MKVRQQIDSAGSSQSQQELQCSQDTMNSRLIKDKWFLCVSEKISNNAVNLIRICFCIFLGLILASNFTAKQYRSLSNGALALNEMLLDKGLKGVFPPLQGTPENLIGNWIFALITENPRTSSRFSHYSLSFKKNGTVQVSSSSCNSIIKMKWYTFYYNIAIVKNSGNSSMATGGAEEDISCIMNNEEFLRILNNASIWTVSSNTLYMVSEENISRKVNPKMLIFKKV